MRALLIDDDIRTTIKALIEKATANPTPLATVMKLAESRAAGNIGAINPMHDHYTIDIPQGYRVTFTHEEQRQCVCRHLSLSVIGAAPGFGPNPTAAEVILKEFGFVNSSKRLYVWADYDVPGIGTVIDFVEPLDGDMMRLRRLT